MKNDAADKMSKPAKVGKVGTKEWGLRCWHNFSIIAHIAFVRGACVKMRPGFPLGKPSGLVDTKQGVKQRLPAGLRHDG